MTIWQDVRNYDPGIPAGWCVISLSVPEGADLEDPIHRLALEQQMDDEAHRIAGFSERTLVIGDWTVTDEMPVVDLLLGKHCTFCRYRADQISADMREHPGGLAIIGALGFTDPPQ